MKYANLGTCAHKKILKIGPSEIEYESDVNTFITACSFDCSVTLLVGYLEHFVPNSCHLHTVYS